jgi:hypothetical protein
MERTAAQIETANIAAMGAEIGKIYSALWQDVAWIHKKWNQYVELFGTNPERIELLNRAAPTFFRTVQDSLLEDVLLHLARLTDPPMSAGRSNLSLRRLSRVLASAPIAAEIEALSSAALDSCQFARDWRNRRLAHRDLDLAVGLNPEPLAHASRASVKAAIATLGELLNSVSRHYCESTTLFDLSPGDMDAANLLYVIRDGLKHDEERFAKVKSGELPPSVLQIAAL